MGVATVVNGSWLEEVMKCAWNSRPRRDRPSHSYLSASTDFEARRGNRRPHAETTATDTLNAGSHGPSGNLHRAGEDRAHRQGHQNGEHDADSRAVRVTASLIGTAARYRGRAHRWLCVRRLAGALRHADQHDVHHADAATSRPSAEIAMEIRTIIPVILSKFCHRIGGGKIVKRPLSRCGCGWRTLRSAPRISFQGRRRVAGAL